MRTDGAEGRGVSGPLSACGEEARFSEMTKKINMYVSFVRGILTTTRSITLRCVGLWQLVRESRYSCMNEWACDVFCVSHRVEIKKNYNSRGDM